MTDTLGVGEIGTDALAIIDQALSVYGLQNLSTWAWDEITSGATTNQVLVDMYSTPQFKARFPGIFIRQQNGLPPISPADYVTYEDNFKQLLNQYGGGVLNEIYNQDEITKLIGGDTSIPEVQQRLQDGFAEISTAPVQVRSAFAQMFGPAGDAALAAYVMDTSIAAPVLEKHVLAAQLQGTAAMSTVDINNALAMQLAQAGETTSQMGNVATQVGTEAPLYTPQVGRTMTPTQTAGVAAATGVSAEAEAEVAAATSEAEGAFKGGGQAEQSQYGSGIGAAKPF